jgi:hypothetical protein
MIKASGLNDRGAPRLLTQSGGRAGWLLFSTPRAHKARCLWLWQEELIHSLPNTSTRHGDDSTPRESGLLHQMEGKDRRNFRQHPHFLGVWLIALISQPITIKASGMDGNNTRMVPKIRPQQLQPSHPETGPRSLKLVLEPR